jgi:hypothetical protein
VWQQAQELNSKPKPSTLNAKQAHELCGGQHDGGAELNSKPKPSTLNPQAHELCGGQHDGGACVREQGRAWRRQRRRPGRLGAHHRAGPLAPRHCRRLSGPRTLNPQPSALSSQPSHTAHTNTYSLAHTQTHTSYLSFLGLSPSPPLLGLSPSPPLLSLSPSPPLLGLSLPASPGLDTLKPGTV